MKVEVTENSIKLIAENSFEEDALKRLRNKGVDNVRFEDDWNFSGPLIINHISHSWDNQ